MRSIPSSKISSPILPSVLATLTLVCAVACGRPAEHAAENSDSAHAASANPMLAHPVTVSGVSAGAYMAVQTQVAFSDRIAGVGVVAGGPYHCAGGSVVNALGPCLSGDGLDATALVLHAREVSASGEIAATDNLRSASVWIFHSPKDVVVGRQVAVALGDFYRKFMPGESILFVDDVESAHGWPTLDAGSDCLELGGDFINACDFDAAGALLNHLYDDLAPRDADRGGDKVQVIDVSTYFESGSSVAETGYVFVPGECRQSGADCRLHVSFHGCQQGNEFVDDRFAVNSGLNEWATRNRIVVVYPQIESSVVNPGGCWDWWGYTGPQYDRANGKQVAGVAAMITAFATGNLYKNIAE